MPIWSQIILKVIVGAFLGTAAGLVLGGVTGCLWALNTPQPYNKALGNEGFQLIGLAFTIVTSMLTGGGIGFVAGAITTLILHVRHSHRASQIH